MKFSAYQITIVLILSLILLTIIVLTITFTVYATVKLLRKLLHGPKADRDKRNDELTKMHIEDL